MFCMIALWEIDLLSSTYFTTKDESKKKKKKLGVYAKDLD